MKIEIEDGTDLEELLAVLRPVSRAVAKGARVRFNLNLLVEVDLGPTATQVEALVDFPDYNSENQTREEKTQQLISHVIQHFHLTAVEFAHRINAAPSAVSQWVNRTRAIGHRHAKSISMTFPCTERFRKELLQIPVK